jgi:excisionase family DNA binding protein
MWTCPVYVEVSIVGVTPFSAPIVSSPIGSVALSKPLFSKPADRKNLDTKQAAEYLGVAAQTLRQWVDEQRIPFGKRGRKVVFDADDLDVWIAEHKVKPISEEVKSKGAKTSRVKSGERTVALDGRDVPWTKSTKKKGEKSEK